LQIQAFAAVSGGSDSQSLKSIQPVLDNSKPSASATPPAAPAQTRVFKIGAGVSQEYILGPGDVLAITDTSEDKAAVQTVPILPDGTAVTSYTGVIEAAGMTLRLMNALVNQQASKWYVNPHLMVNLAKQRPMQVYLLGEVSHPGLYTAGSDSGMTAPQGGNDDASDGDQSGGGGMAGLSAGGSAMTLTGALQLSGGLKETADVRNVRVTRQAPKQVFQIDLWKLMIDGDVSEDISLQPGDVIYVPKGGAEFDNASLGRTAHQTEKVRMFGAFKNPGLISMDSSDDILSAIAKAGGFAPAAITKYVLLARINRDGTITTEKVPYDKGLKDSHSQLRTKLHAGDLIIAKTSGAKTAFQQTGKYVPQMLMMGAMAFLYRL
jgi:polysaccharide export outer membrane protein